MHPETDRLAELDVSHKTQNFYSSNCVNDDLIYSGRETGQARKKIKNSNLTWLRLKHPQRHVKKT
jgi:hypothetical protein